MALSLKFIFIAALLIVAVSADTGDYGEEGGNEGPAGTEPPLDEGYDAVDEYIPLDEYEAVDPDSGSENYLDYIAPPLDDSSAPDNGAKAPSAGPPSTKKPTVKPPAPAPADVKPKPAAVLALPPATGPVVQPILTDFIPRSAGVCVSVGVVAVATIGAVLLM
jgi:hypothetical protein